METSPVTCHTLEEFYHIDGHTFEKQYKEVLSGFRQWDQLEHAAEWLLFPENVGPRLAIDESSLSNGELYTFVTNREAHTREQSLVAVVAGTKAEDVIAVLQRIDEERRNAVEEVTLDLSDSMRKIVRTAFPKASRVIDRFHIQKLACDAVQELRVKHRWEAIQQANNEMEEARQKGKEYNPYRFPNGDTRKELLIRSRYLLFKSADKWTDRQKQRAAILFGEYPDIQTAYGLCHSLRMIFTKNTIKNAARLSMARWYNKVEKAGFHSFNIIAATFYEHYEEILNFYNNRSSNALAESFNAKVKLFRANLRGVASSGLTLEELLIRSSSYSVLQNYMHIPTKFLLSPFSFHPLFFNPAERGGFEPPKRFRRLHAFQACLFSHSSISPCVTLHGFPYAFAKPTAKIIFLTLLSAKKPYFLHLAPNFKPKSVVRLRQIACLCLADSFTPR